MDWLPFLTYAFIATFTPGPNNIMATTSGITYGYRKSLPFIGGITFGFFTIMAVSSLFVDKIYIYFPNIEMPLRLLGAGYIGWLAFKVFTAKPKFDADDDIIFSLKKGVLMQYINPKAIIYGVTVMSGFVVPHIKNFFMLICLSLFLAGLAFASTSLWAFAGSIFFRYLVQNKTRKVFNAIMALLLIYCSFSILKVI